MTMCLSNFHLMYMHIIATGEWTTPSTSGTPPTSRQGHAVAVVGDRMFVHGGMSGQQIFNDIHVLDLSKCSLSLSLSHPCTCTCTPEKVVHSFRFRSCVLYTFC